ncbi:helix-turn-helix domain-containing protein [Thalassomonas sp. M1454]|uniref:helix-turn-helix domain-containing protein n=1 Tax=Thalassomonas sp. M1454 TaxID=2594477 RepID=UPI00163D79DA|nr:helix-turn-helix transcriptional regulator [Thalassomonas sp. M1454]
MYPNFYVADAIYLKSIIDVLDDLNAPTEKLLSSVTLTRSHVATEQNLILELPIWQLMENSAKHVTRDEFGLLVGELFADKYYKQLMPELFGQDNLEQAINLFFQFVKQQSNCPNFWLKEDGDNYWLCRIGTPGIINGEEQIEQLVVSMLLTFLQHYLGKDWQPNAIKFKSVKSSNKVYLNKFPATQCSFANECTAIAIDKQHFKFNNKLPLQAIEQQPISRDPKLLITRLLAENYFGNNADANKIAKMLNINLRKLQRILSEQKSNLKELIDDDKKHKAQRLLATSQLSITEICQELGYKDKGNFNRAFKRWFNTTPLKYRKVRQS